MSRGRTCSVCGGYIVPPTMWMSVDPPPLCKTAYPNQPRGCGESQSCRPQATGTFLNPTKPTWRP